VGEGGAAEDPAAIDLAPGETVTCTFNNRISRGNIVVDKVTDPSGSSQSFDFETSYAPGGFSLTDGAAPNDSGDLLPTSESSTYSVAEVNVPSGWTLSSVSCVGEGGAAEDPAAIDLAPGETVTCTFNNGSGEFNFSSGQFADFDLFTPGGLEDLDEKTFGDLLPGSYDFTEEAAAAGFDFSNVECVDNQSQLPVASSDTTTVASSDTTTVAFALLAGQHVTCTFRNIERGSYIIEKVFVGGTAEASFEAEVINQQIENFTLPDSLGQTTNSEVGNNLPPDVYTVTEGLIDGWTLASIECTDESGAIDADTSIDLSTRQAHIGLGEGQEITCVFMNVPAMAVTDSSLCIFDRNLETEDVREWRRIFIQDPQNWPNYAFKATNPGQFFWNVSVQGNPGDTVDVTLRVPWPFVTQGARPIHVYPSIGYYERQVDEAPEGTLETCFIPGGMCSDPPSGTTIGCAIGPDGVDPCEAQNAGSCVFTEDAIANEIVLSDYTLDGDLGKTGYYAGTGSEPTFRDVTFQITIPETGFAYVNQHLDDGLKGPHVDADGDGLPDRYMNGGEDNAVFPGDTSFVLIPEMAEHTFCIAPDAPGEVCDSVFNDNEFKKFRGFAGMVVDSDGYPESHFDLVIKDPEGNTISKDPQLGVVLLGNEFYTDGDGYYTLAWQHKGKTADYTVRPKSPVPVGTQFELNGVLDTCPNTDCIVPVPLGGKYKFGEVNFILPLP
jgi:plastocyanin